MFQTIYDIIILKKLICKFLVAISSFEKALFFDIEKYTCEIWLKTSSDEAQEQL